MFKEGVLMRFYEQQCELMKLHHISIFLSNCSLISFYCPRQKGKFSNFLISTNCQQDFFYCFFVYFFKNCYLTVISCIQIAFFFLCCWDLMWHCMFLQVQIIRAGNKKVLNKLMGEVQRETKGRTDPVQIRAILEDMTLWYCRKNYPVCVSVLLCTELLFADQ